MKNGITDVRDFATGSLGIPDGRMVLRSTSRNIYEHISFLSLDSSPVFAVFAISGDSFINLGLDSLFHGYCSPVFGYKMPELQITLDV